VLEFVEALLLKLLEYRVLLLGPLSLLLPLSRTFPALHLVEHCAVPLHKITSVFSNMK
jgi:hypothetical protein